MPRLYRPAIPVATKCKVVLRQLGEFFVEDVLMAHRFIPSDQNKRSYGQLLSDKLGVLSELLKCEVSELRLDHDPPLGARQRRGEGKRTVYKPDANDPEYLRYRPHGTQHAGSHDVKTRIRGDHGQFSDVALIKRARRRAAKEKRPKVRFAKVGRKPRSRPIMSGNRWPPKGSRKIENKRKEQN